MHERSDRETTMQFDLPLDELRAYRPEVRRPEDFEEFWSSQVDEARSSFEEPVFTPVTTILTSADVLDVSFSGHGGTRIKGWLLVPKLLEPEVPVIVEYIGYSGGRGRPIDRLGWVSAGFPHLVMDTRGQGWRNTGSDTADTDGGGQPGASGFMMRGIEAPQNHYFTRLYVDAALALDVPDAFAATAGRGVVAAGGSQGGALALAAASLNPRAAASMPDVPFMADFQRAVEITDVHPYEEIAEYCRLHPERIESVFDTLSYLDVVNHADRITCRGYFSVGLADRVTPPSTVFATYNHFEGPKSIEVYPFNGHEGGGSLHFERKVAWLRS